MKTNVITTQNVRKWGNSMGVRLPQRVITQARLELDGELTISVKDGSIILTPVRSDPKMTLQSMLIGVTPADIGGELDWGAPVGKEAW